jgi:hypothetical protein
MVQQVADLVRVFFGYFGTILKCVSLCGDGAASARLGSSFFGYFSTVLKYIRLCGNGVVVARRLNLNM